MDYKKTAIRIIAEVSRVILGVVFTFSGIVKAVDPMGFSIKIEDYLVSFGMDFLKPFSVLLSFNLSAIEFTLGVCILLGAYRLFSSILALIFMVVMTPLTLYLAIYNPVSDCGCFGDAVIISNWETFYKNVVLLAAAIIILIYNQRLTRIYTYKAYWFVFFFSFLFCAGFAYRNYFHLPMIDFRPYKIGVNIPEAMEIPDGAPEDEYLFTFIYEKEGVKKEFTLDNYPANDESWTFVESKTVLVKEGYHPPIDYFGLYDNRDDDVTEEILTSEKPVILIISSKLEKASDERIDEINNMFDYCTDNDIQFYCVTSSNEQEIKRWSDNTGAEYPFLRADDTLLKTIIRSNPGMILLDKGTIRMKWHYKDIPAEEDIEKVITGYLTGEVDEYGKQRRRIWNNVLIFTLPLLLVWVYDYFRNRRKEKRVPANAENTPNDK